MRTFAGNWKGEAKRLEAERDVLRRDNSVLRDEITSLSTRLHDQFEESTSVIHDQGADLIAAQFCVRCLLAGIKSRATMGCEACPSNGALAKAQAAAPVVPNAATVRPLAAGDLDTTASRLSGEVAPASAAPKKQKSGAQKRKERAAREAATARD